MTQKDVVLFVQADLWLHDHVERVGTVQAVQWFLEECDLNWRQYDHVQLQEVPGVIDRAVQQAFVGLNSLSQENRVIKVAYSLTTHRFSNDSTYHH